MQISRWTDRKSDRRRDRHTDGHTQTDMHTYLKIGRQAGRQEGSQAYQKQRQANKRHFNLCSSERDQFVFGSDILRYPKNLLAWVTRHGLFSVCLRSNPKPNRFRLLLGIHGESSCRIPGPHLLTQQNVCRACDCIDFDTRRLFPFCLLVRFPGTRNFPLFFKIMSYFLF